MNNIQLKKVAIIVALMALMAATRMHHFTNGLHLSDASLAVFLLAGVLVASPLWFGVLFLEAAALDYIAITQMGISDYCVTPAYWFLIPTYAILWMAGRYYAHHHQNNLRSLGLFTGIALASLSVAFVISNASFYFFSGRYPDLNGAGYAAQVVQYYVPYVSGAVIYLLPAVLLQVIFTRSTDMAQHA
ncbi:MAG: hypothetical protein R8K48_04600 [Gallionella sp.]